jgi:putative tryptophan/tyrosine transport system substrate-binding protein
MKRRPLLAMVGTCAWPAYARPVAAQRRIGFLVTGAAQPHPFRVVTQVLEELARNGLAAGPALQVHVRHGSDLPQLEAGARDLLDLDVELIVASFTPAAVAAQRATRDKPIVMAGVGDPVASGLVPSLAAPGGNVTGVSAQATDLAVKNLQLLRDWLPALRQVAVLVHASDPWTPTFLGALQQAAPPLGFTLLPGRAAGPADYAALFAHWARRGAQALVVQPSLPFDEAVLLAQRQRWPSCSPAPGRLPVQQVDRFSLVLNLRSSRELGLAVPRAIRLRADEVIE